MANWASLASGVNDELKALVAQRLFEQMQAAKLADMEQRRAMQTRGLDLQAGGLDLSRQRFGEDVRQFDVSRADELAAAEQTRASAAAQSAAFDEFAGGLPAHLQTTARAKKFGLTLSPVDVMQAPETPEQIDLRKLKHFGEEQKIRTGEEMKLIGARGHEARQTAAAATADRGPEKPLSPPQQARVADIDASLHSLDKLEEAFEAGAKDLIGPAAGRVRNVGQATGINVNPVYAQFKAETDTLRNQIIKAITGAALSEAEAVRIMGQIPSETDAPGVWLAKAKATRDNQEYLRQRTIDLAGGGSARPGAARPTAPAPTSGAKPDYRKKYGY